MRIAVALGMMLALTSCQPPPYNLVVRMVGGQLVIDAVGDTGLFGWGDEDIGAGMVTIYNRAGRGWTIYTPETPASCDTGSDKAPWPLTYGKVPRCYVEKAPADPIEPGVIYKIEAGASLRMAQGGFKVTPSGVVALEANAMGAGGEAWPPESNPGYINFSQYNGMAPENGAEPGNAQ